MSQSTGSAPTGASTDASTDAANAAPAVAWPALTWEWRTWEPDPGGGTRRERAGVAQRYRSTVVPRIADVDLMIPAAMLSDLDDATAALASFDVTHRLRSAAAFAVLMRSESASSSRIEQITASARRIAEAELTGQGTPNATLVAANVHAMATALAIDGPLDADQIERVQSVLLAEADPASVGWRHDVVWIGGGGSTPPTADFVPPHHAEIHDAITDLVAFMARDDLPILPQVAIAHAQLETIHPFADGNGRTGRALIHALLRQKGLVRSATVPISAGLLRDKDRYFDSLIAFRSGDAGPVISLFVHAALHAVRHGLSLVERLDTIQHQWRSQITARSDSAVWRLLDALPDHPVLDAPSAAVAIGTDSRNVHRHLRTLCDAGILVRNYHQPLRRDLFRAPEILSALDEYAVAFGRRE